MSNKQTNWHVVAQWKRVRHSKLGGAHHANHTKTKSLYARQYQNGLKPGQLHEPIHLAIPGPAGPGSRTTPRRHTGTVNNKPFMFTLLSATLCGDSFVCFANERPPDQGEVLCLHVCDYLVEYVTHLHCRRVSCYGVQGSFCLPPVTCLDAVCFCSMDGKQCMAVGTSKISHPTSQMPPPQRGELPPKAAAMQKTLAHPPA